jgi:hypothetical protein
LIFLAVLRHPHRFSRRKIMISSTLRRSCAPSCSLRTATKSMNESSKRGFRDANRVWT